MIMVLINAGLGFWDLSKGEPSHFHHLMSTLYFCTFLILSQIDRSAKDSKTVEIAKDWPSKGVKMKMFDF